MFMRSISPFWKASRRAWSSSMMLISTRPTWGIFLPFISAIELRVAGSAELEIPREAAVVGVGLEDDLVAADPLLQHVGPGADRVAHHAAGLVAVRLDDFARDARGRLVREDVRRL